MLTDAQHGRPGNFLRRCTVHRRFLQKILVPWLLVGTLLTLGTFSASTSTGASTAPSVKSTSVDNDGNLVVNGMPFLMIQGTNVAYDGWRQAGYSEAQADAKLAQMKSWGFNTLFGNWGEVFDGSGHQDLAAWQRHGFYWHGAATLSDMGDGNIENYGQPSNPAIVTIVNKFKSRPNLLLWWICNEYNEGTYELTGQPLGVAVSTGRQTIRNADPAHAVGETIVIPINYWTNHAEALLPSFQVPLGEEIITGFESGEAFLHAYDYLNEMQPYLGRKSGAPNFVLGFSSTPVSEIDGGNTDVRAVTQNEVDRYFLFQVAMNVRAFDVLWGANQRDAQDNTGDAGISQAVRTAWQRTGQAVAKVKALESVILAPGLWQKLSTKPKFEAYTQIDPSDSGNDFSGIYAAKKTVNGVTYVIALNSTFRQDGLTEHWTEQGVSGATLNVGFPIKSAIRMFETGAVAASGSVITDNFAPMAVHVYVVK